METLGVTKVLNTCNKQISPSVTAGVVVDAYDLSVTNGIPVDVRPSLPGDDLHQGNHWNQVGNESYPSSIQNADRVMRPLPQR